MANQITLGVGTYGYTENTTSDQLKTNYNYGIYNKSTSSYFWIASPGNDYSISEFRIGGSEGPFYRSNVDKYSYGVRQIVCIQTPVFNEKYTLSNPEDNS